MVIKRANPRDKYNASCRSDMEQTYSASTATTYRKQFVDHHYQKKTTAINLCETSEGHQDHIYAKNVTTKPGLLSHFDHFAVAYSFKFWTVCKSVIQLHLDKP